MPATHNSCPKRTPDCHERRGFPAIRQAHVLSCLLAVLLVFSCSCGLIFDDEFSRPKAPPKARDEEESTAIPLPYDVRFVVEQSPGADGKKDENAGGLASRMEPLSQLVSLRKSPPDGEVGLEMRARKDVETAIKLMGSEGYYEGDADLRIDGADSGKAQVVITLRPGPRYVVGEIAIMYSPQPKLPLSLADQRDKIFRTDSLPRIRSGRPALAKDLMESVQKLTPRMHKNGFPDAKIVEEAYYLDREKRTVNVLVEIDPGEPATLGRPIFTGESSVNASYLEKLVPWEAGSALWNSERVDNYVTRLRRTGLFQRVSLVDVDRREGGSDTTVAQKPVGIMLEDAKHRTVGAMLRYDTDTGLGAEAHWEHRNLFGNGEKLELTAPYTATNRGLEMDFTKPAFLGERQVLRVHGAFMDETTDAYDRTGVVLGTGIRRRWARGLFTETGVFADVGSLQNNEQDRKDYSIYGLHLKGRWDRRNDRRNPVSGTLAELTLRPMTGQYGGDFSAVGSEMRMSAYWAPFTRRNGAKSDKLVFAGQIGLGAITGATLNNLPSTYRYYLGGMDTVRGYGYQQIGPMDKDGDPTGGRSYQLVNLESRFKVTDSLGFVAFLDGGKLYEEEWPLLDTDMDWGAGVGVRYFTPIGPVRLDIAVPLKKDVEPPLQFYISIGQSF